MKTVALLHTVASVYETFGPALARAAGPLAVYNLLDDFLALDANARGVFTDQNKARLRLDLRSLEKTGADAIVVTCSTLSPHLAPAREGIACPVFAIDEAMVARAAAIGGRLVIMATAQSAVGPVSEAIARRAQALGRAFSIEHAVCKQAMAALRAGDRARHDQLLEETARGIASTPDAVVLAQASMAHMDGPLAKLLGCPVLQSPGLCIEQVKAYLEGGDKP